MNPAPRTTLQIVINALFVLSYLSAFGFFAFTMAHGFINQSADYVPALAVMMAIMKTLGIINKKLSNHSEQKMSA